MCQLDWQSTTVTVVATQVFLHFLSRKEISFDKTQTLQLSLPDKQTKTLVFTSQLVMVYQSEFGNQFTISHGFR